MEELVQSRPPWGPRVLLEERTAGPAATCDLVRLLPNGHSPRGWPRKPEALHTLLWLRPGALGDSLPVHLPPNAADSGCPGLVALRERNTNQAPPHRHGAAQEAGAKPKPGPDSHSSRGKKADRPEEPRQATATCPCPSGAWARNTRAPAPISCDVGQDAVMFPGLNEGGTPPSVPPSSQKYSDAR